MDNEIETAWEAFNAERNKAGDWNFLTARKAFEEGWKAHDKKHGREFNQLQILAPNPQTGAWEVVEVRGAHRERT